MSEQWEELQEEHERLKVRYTKACCGIVIVVAVVVVAEILSAMLFW